MIQIELCVCVHIWWASARHWEINLMKLMKPCCKKKITKWKERTHYVLSGNQLVCKWGENERERVAISLVNGNGAWMVAAATILIPSTEQTIQLQQNPETTDRQLDTKMPHKMLFNYFPRTCQSKGRCTECPRLPGILLSISRAYTKSEREEELYDSRKNII
jgi:hypothetical protein